MVPDVQAWLLTHPVVSASLVWEAPGEPNEGVATAVSYSNWSAQQKTDLQTAFKLAWSKGPYPNFAEPAANEIEPTLDDYPLTILSTSDFWALYVSLIAQSLRTELAKDVSWSVTEYGPDLLAVLFDSRSIAYWHHSEYVYSGDNDQQVLIGDYVVNSWSLPAHGSVARGFIDSTAIISPTRHKTILTILRWCGANMFHFIGGSDTQTAINTWQYRGLSPISRVIQGTVAIGVGLEEAGVRHWVRGCAGVQLFLIHTLRTINIPVQGTPPLPSACDHAQVHFPTEGQFMAHGDDIYSLRTHPEFSGEEILMDQTTFTSLFGPQVSDIQKCKNVSYTSNKYP